MIENVKKELIDRLIRVRPKLSPKKRRVADFMMEDYKRLFLMTAKEIAEKCRVSEPTITRFVMDLGFGGYGEFERYLKGVLRDELTSVERLLKTGQDPDTDSTLNAYIQSTVTNLENMAKLVSEEELKHLASIIFHAESFMVAGYKASATLVCYFGYLLKKIKKNVRIDTLYAWENLDYIALHGKGLVLFVIAYPRYPVRVLELVEYARQHEVEVICLTDSLKSPVVNLSDHYVVIDMEGFSFVDPFSHIITFLGALIHEIAHHDEPASARRLTKIEDGVRSRGEFFSEEMETKPDYDPLKMAYFNHL
jgi:DNA-binding MurR/RpiR family transcriptional regulator